MKIYIDNHTRSGIFEITTIEEISPFTIKIKLDIENLNALRDILDQNLDYDGKFEIKMDHISLFKCFIACVHINEKEMNQYGRVELDKWLGDRMISIKYDFFEHLNNKNFMIGKIREKNLISLLK